MVIGSCELYLTAEWVKSLKEKRMIVKSIIDKSKNRFNISIAEVGSHDVHKTIEIGFACVSTASNHANSIIDNVVNFIENISDAVIDNIKFEIF